MIKKSTLTINWHVQTISTIEVLMRISIIRWNHDWSLYLKSNRMKHIVLLSLCCFLLFKNSIGQITKTVDICIYGGTSAGVIAAYTAKKLNKTVLLIEPGKHLGGLSSGGLGYTDIGNKYAITGLSRDFYRRIGNHYGKFEQWIFEPHVAEQTFQQYINEAKVEVLYQYQVTDAKKENGYITEIKLQHTDNATNNEQIIKAKMFIDCSYEGDLMAKAVVSYVVGREANTVFNETYNGVQLRDKHQFPDGIDPYKITGKPESGLLWGISSASLANQGDGDKKVQAYNFRICLSSDPANLIPIDKPEGYDPARYELLLRVLEKKPAKDLWAFLKFDLMPNHKTDINNNGPFSTDMIGMNYDYPEADYTTRKQIIRTHEEYVKGLLYFIGHDARMPEHLRKEMLKWGYPKDEYADNNHWSPQMYVREARRMTGEYVMTQANCEGSAVVDDGVGMAAYTMDSHNCQRLVVNGMVKNEGDVQIGGFGPYPISYRSIVPKAGECKNLVVPVCLSATHIAYGSIRMEPVFMVLAQSAATAAALAIEKGNTIQQVNVKAVQQMLVKNPLADGSTPEVLVDNDDSLHVVVTGNWEKQKTGSYGPSMFIDNSKGSGNKSIRFTPDLSQTGSYHIYTYIPKLSNLSSRTTIKIYDGKRFKQVTIAAKDIKVEGQTSGEWISLGSYRLSKGKNAFVEITNNHADGIVIADAVLFVTK